jgi:hypothetical protein
LKVQIHSRVLKHNLFIFLKKKKKEEEEEEEEEGKG